MSEAQSQEFWRWKESNWKDPDTDWQAAKYVTVGVDVGSVSHDRRADLCLRQHAHGFGQP
jgi:hypothetical protein